MDRWPTRRTEWLLCAVAAVGWLLLTLPVWTSDSLSLDEHVSFWIAGDGNPGTLLGRSLDAAATPPLSSLVQRAALAVGGNHAVVLRLPSLAALLAAIGVVALAARRQFGPLAAALAAVGLAWHPDLWDTGRLARPYGLTLALSAAALLATAGWTHRPRSRGWPIFWIAALSALIWNHYVNLPFVALLAAATALRLGVGRDRSLTWVWLGSLAAIGALAFPLLRGFLRVWDLREFLGFLSAAPAFTQQAGWFLLIVLPAASAMALLVRPKADREKNAAGALERKTLWMLAALGPGLQLAFFALSQTVSPTLGHPRYALACAPASVLLVAGLLARLREGTAATVLLGALGAAWLFVGSPPWKSPVIQSQDALDWRDLGRKVEAEGAPGEPLFVYSGLVEGSLVPSFLEDSDFLDYVACRLGRFYVADPHPRIPLPYFPAQVPDCLPHYGEVLRQARLEGRAVWLAAAQDTDLARETASAFRRHLLSSGWKPVAELKTPTARLEQFRSQ